MGRLYPSVGHGGASGCPAVVSLIGLALSAMSTAALLLNVPVVGTPFVTAQPASDFSWRLIWPLAPAFLPAALVRGGLHAATEVQLLVLGGVLAYAALLLMRLPRRGNPVEGYQGPARWIARLAGAGLGLVSGVAGVRGGMLLGPLRILLRRADAKGTAATSGAGTVINSSAGLTRTHDRRRADRPLPGRPPFPFVAPGPRSGRGVARGRLPVDSNRMPVR